MNVYTFVAIRPSHVEAADLPDSLHNFTERAGVECSLRLGRSAQRHESQNGHKYLVEHFSYVITFMVG
jgi:hypothetical protein